MGESERNGAKPTGEILWDAAKKEAATPTTSYKKIYKKMKQEYQCSVLKEAVTLDRLQEASLVVFAGPREMFSTDEFKALKDYIAGGGSVLFMLGEGGEAKHQTNINYLLEEFGVSVNSDAVVRTVFHKYHHPKEVFISNGILCQDISRCAWGEPKKLAEKKRDELSIGVAREDDGPEIMQHRGGCDFVYPYGSTLNVQKPAIPILSSGPISYPLNRPVAAAYSKASTGRFIVLGSYKLFDDDWFEKEKNSKLADVLFKWLLHGNDCELSYPYGDEPELNDYQYVPHTQSLADNLQSCLQESDPLPRDFTELFDDALFNYDTNLIPEAIKLYAELGVKHELLTLIAPQFETPMPALQPTVFPPCMREPPPPALDLFDLDEQFASERIRLAQLTNKCTDEDLDYYVREAGEILGVTAKLQGDRSAKATLEYIFHQLVNFKKLNQESQYPLDENQDGMGMPAL
mmetsp:Transcript_45851/g.103839  ORF Transcript_45851/g.103839 Transcript_45851/m.103839 type:complete len:461 (+) Transcript_45851:52-1434(+)